MPEKRALRISTSEGKRKGAWNDLELPDQHFVEGGFSAINPSAHAVEDNKDPSLVRVVVGTFATLDLAREAQKDLGALGYSGLVEPLPDGTAVDEVVSTNEG